jgi:hypothetical protein
MKKRILLQRGKQKELIERTKYRLQISWNKLAKILGIGENYLLNELRNEQRTLSEEIYKKLCYLSKLNYDEFIVERLNENWGQIKGGKSVKNRKNLFREKPPKLLCKPSKELAEIIGVILGDGSIYTIPKKSIYQVCVAGNLKDEKKYMINYIKPLFEKVFKIKMNVKQTTNTIYVWKQSKDLVYTLNKYGLPAGNKKNKNVKIPVWIMSNNLFLSSCLRGLFDTDGCVYPKNKTNLYPTIWISSTIPSLRFSITKACEKLGFRISKWRKTRNDSCIDKREDVFNFFNKIKPNNPKHIARWLKFNKPPSSSPVNQILYKLEFGNR